MGKVNAMHMDEIAKKDGMIIALLEALEDLSAALDNEGNPAPFTTLNDRARYVIQAVRDGYL